MVNGQPGFVMVVNPDDVKCVDICLRRAAVFRAKKALQRSARQGIKLRNPGILEAPDQTFCLETRLTLLNGATTRLPPASGISS
jgi:hypothetical protein